MKKTKWKKSKTKSLFFQFCHPKKVCEHTNKQTNRQTDKQTNRQTITAGGRCLQRCIKFTCSLQHVASQHIETRSELLYMEWAAPPPIPYITVSHNYLQILEKLKNHCFLKKVKKLKNHLFKVLRQKNLNHFFLSFAKKN